jgi:hypothetical protein
MRKRYVYVFSLLIILYLSLALTLPSDPAVLARHSISQTQARLLNLTIVVPVSIIYTVALYGYIQFRDYAEAIRKSKEGQHYIDISKGLSLLVLALPLGAVMNSFVSYAKFNLTDVYVTSFVIQTYVNLLLALAGILLVARGVDGLYRTLSIRTNFKLTYKSIIAIITSTSAYIWLVTSQSPESTIEGAYRLPEWVVVFTLAIPYLFIWILGAKTTYTLYRYKQNVKGIIYKKSFDSLYKGFGLIIVISIFIRLITTLSEQFNRLNLTPLLGVVYLLVILYALGYGLLARGSRGLKKIEDA